MMVLIFRIMIDMILEISEMMMKMKMMMEKITVMMM